MRRKVAQASSPESFRGQPVQDRQDAGVTVTHSYAISWSAPAKRVNETRSVYLKQFA
jgi:hypothetical protein